MHLVDMHSKITKHQETGTFIAAVRQRVDEAKHLTDVSDVGAPSYDLPLVMFGSPITQTHISSIGGQHGNRPSLNGFRVDLYKWITSELQQQGQLQNDKSITQLQNDGLVLDNCCPIARDSNG